MTRACGPWLLMGTTCRYAVLVISNRSGGVRPTYTKTASARW